MGSCGQKLECRAAPGDGKVWSVATGMSAWEACEEGCQKIVNGLRAQVLGVLSAWVSRFSRMMVEVGMEQVPTSWGRVQIQEICREKEGEAAGMNFKSAEGSHSLLEIPI